MPIVPFQPIEFEPRDELISQISDIIDDAAGSRIAIDPYRLASRILDAVDQSDYRPDLTDDDAEVLSPALKPAAESSIRDDVGDDF